MSPKFKQFRCGKYCKICEIVPAFRWKDGKVYGISINGDIGHDTEYLYVHLQKRAMTFTPGLENENSFMIIPNEFVRDHELTQNEISSLITPNSEYERTIHNKYGRRFKNSRVELIRLFLKQNNGSIILSIKWRLNKLLGRKLSSMWKSRGVADTYSI